MLKPRPLLIAALALTGAGAALHPAPAYAGRAAACKAPPFSVPSETQRAVDAAIDARIASAGSGKVGTSVDTRTEFETTTLTQDAIARAWVEYTLCLKLAKRLIGQDLHDELLRGLLTPRAEPAPTAAQPTAPATNASAPAPAPPVSIDDLLGSWTVVSRFDYSTCGDIDAPQTTTYGWLFSQAAGGGVEVAVLGETAFPKLEGHLVGDRIRLGAQKTEDGEPDLYPVAETAQGVSLAMLTRSDFDLNLQDGRLSGRREVAFWTSRYAEELRSLIIETCVLHYQVEAQR